MIRAHQRGRSKTENAMEAAPRTKSLGDLKLLQQVNQASLNEVLEFIERENLYGLGCGLVDMTLLASTLISPRAKLWTLDKRLASLAERFGIAHQVNFHLVATRKVDCRGALRCPLYSMRIPDIAACTGD